MQIYHWDRSTDTLTVVPTLVKLADDERIIKKTPVTCGAVNLLVQTEFSYIGDFLSPDAVFTTTIHEVLSSDVSILLARWDYSSSESARKGHDVACETLREHGIDFVERVRSRNRPVAQPKG